MHATPPGVDNAVKLISFQVTSDVYSVGLSVQTYFESLVKHFLPCYVDFLNQGPISPGPYSDPSGGGDGGPLQKKRRNAAPDSTRDNNSPEYLPDLI